MSAPGPLQARDVPQPPLTLATFSLSARASSGRCHLKPRIEPSVRISAIVSKQIGA